MHIIHISHHRGAQDVHSPVGKRKVLSPMDAMVERYINIHSPFHSSWSRHLDLRLGKFLSLKNHKKNPTCSYYG